MLLTYLTCMLKIAIFLQTPHRRPGTFPTAKKGKKQEFPTYVQNNGGDCAHSSHSFASGGPISFSSGKGYFALRRDPLLPTAAKVGKNAVQTCGLKICPRPVHCALLLLRPTRTRQGENHPKCGIDLRLSPLPLKMQNVELRTGAFQSKSGSAQRNTSVQHFGRTRTRRHAAEGNPKTMGFWRRSFPHFFRC